MRFSLIILGLVLAQFACAQTSDRYGAMELRQRIFFDSSDASLDSLDMRVLNNIANLMMKRPNGLFEVEGHTDSTGSILFNEKLGLLRAQVIRDQLVQLGVPKSNLILRGRGETEPFRIHGRYMPDKCRRVEFRQVVRLKVQAKDAKSNAIIEAHFKVQFPVMPFGDWEIDSKNGTYTWVFPYRKAYYLQSDKMGYISSLDTIKPDLRKENGSDIQLEIRLRPAIIKERINFESIYFNVGRASIMDGSEESLQKIYDLLKNNPDAYIEIRGHVSQPNVDKLPDEVIEQGVQLSKKRAESIYQEMINRGISPTRMTFRGMGSTEMKYPSPSSDEEKQMNRRVEVLILELK